MNIYDKIKSPINSEQKLEELIKIYANLKEKQQLNKMYNYVVSNRSQISVEESKKYSYNYFTYIVEPAITEIAEKIRNGNYIREDETFKHLYGVSDMRDMFQEKSVQEIIRRGRQLESKNQQIFDRLNPIFWENGEKDRRELYERYLQENNIQLNKEEMLDWMDYRAVIEECQNPRFMGFHYGESLQDDEKMKFYINAGENTYELANLFYSECRRRGINTKFKVAMGNMSSEINRSDKLCIYLDDLKKVESYIEILTKIKSEKLHFEFQSPMLTAGTIDNWIGIGSDVIGGTSYNNDMCNTITKVFEQYFENMNFDEISAQISKNPQLLNEIKATISKESLLQGRSPEKLCIREADVEELKGIEMNEISTHNDNTTSNDDTRNLEQFISNINPNKINIETLQILYENQYNGEIENSAVKMAYQLYCDNKAKEEKIEGLEGLVKEDEKVINQLTTKINRLHEITSKIKQALTNIESKTYKVGNNANRLEEKLEKEKSKSIFQIIAQKIKRRFSKTPMLPELADCEEIYKESMDVWQYTTSCRFKMQSYDEKESIQEINTILRQRQSMRKSVDILEKGKEDVQDFSEFVEFEFGEGK